MRKRKAPAAEVKPSSGWSARYIRCMRKVWSHPSNDQRTAVLGWLPYIVPEGSVIVDVGAGDGYYAAVLRPSRYIFVEPIPTLFSRCAANLKDAGVEALGFRTVAELFQSKCWEFADMVLLVHALLYLEFSELELVLKMASGRPCAMVYPDIERSVTVAFEDEIEQEASRKIANCKESLFGDPTIQQRVDSHFRFRKGTKARDIAFVVSHLLLRESDTTNVEESALSFVRARQDIWRRKDASWEVPQAQRMEYWACVKGDDSSDEQM